MSNSTVCSFIAAAIHIADVPSAWICLLIDIDDDITADGTACVVATKHIVDTAIRNIKGDITGDIGLIGTTIHVVNALTFAASASNKDLVDVGLACRMVTTAIQLFDMHVTSICGFIHMDSDGSYDFTTLIIATVHLVDRTTLDPHVAVTTNAGSRITRDISAITAAVHLSDGITAGNGDIGGVHISSVATAIYEAYLGIAFLHQHFRNTVHRSCVATAEGRSFHNGLIATVSISNVSDGELRVAIYHGCRTQTTSEYIATDGALFQNVAVLDVHHRTAAIGCLVAAAIHIVDI